MQLVDRVTLRVSTWETQISSFFPLPFLKLLVLYRLLSREAADRIHGRVTAPQRLINHNLILPRVFSAPDISVSNATRVWTWIHGKMHHCLSDCSKLKTKMTIKFCLFDFLLLLFISKCENIFQVGSPTPKLFRLSGYYCVIVRLREYSRKYQLVSCESAVLVRQLHQNHLQNLLAQHQSEGMQLVYKRQQGFKWRNLSVFCGRERKRMCYDCCKWIETN